MKTVAAVLCLALLGHGFQGVQPSAQDPKQATKDALDAALSDEVQKACGLRKLANEERATLARLLALRRNDQRALDEARAILEGMGLELVKCATAKSRDGTSWFLVSERIGGTSATKDIPITFPELTFSEGYYWCDRAALGGIDRIYVGGQEYRFLLADWKDL